MHFRTTRSMHLPLAWRVERGFFIAVCAIALVVGVIGFGSHAAKIVSHEMCGLIACYGSRVHSAVSGSALPRSNGT